MATPVLDKELVKLRRRLGDVFTEAKVEITTANIGSVDGNVWTKAEIVDIYNDAVRDFLRYVVTSIPREEWYAYIRGFLIYMPDAAFTAGVLDATTFNPALFAVLSLSYTLNTEFTHVATFVEPSEWLRTKAGRFPNRNPSAKELYFTILGNESAGESVLILPAENYSAVEMIYVQSFEDLVQGTDELTGLSEEAKRKVLDFAEAEAVKQKQAVAPELVQKMLDMKSKV